MFKKEIYLFGEKKSSLLSKEGNTFSLRNNRALFCRVKTENSGSSGTKVFNKSLITSILLLIILISFDGREEEPTDSGKLLVVDRDEGVSWCSCFTMISWILLPLFFGVFEVVKGASESESSRSTWGVLDGRERLTSEWSEEACVCIAPSFSNCFLTTEENIYEEELYLFLNFI